MIDPDFILAYKNRAAAYHSKKDLVKERADRDLIAKLEMGLKKQEIDEGDVSLFDGKDFTGWKGATTAFAVDNGVIVSPKFDPKFPRKVINSSIYTDRDFGDFICRFEFELEAGPRNGGIAVRGVTSGDPGR